MSDHDFEKQVQQKMEQLKLRPSDAVWTKVDKRIRKERRRRRVVLWLPLFLLCVVAGGYFISETQSDNKFTASEKNSTLNDTHPNNSGKQENGTSVSPTTPATGAATPANNNSIAGNDNTGETTGVDDAGPGQSIPPSAPLPSGQQHTGAAPADNGPVQPKREVTAGPSGKNGFSINKKNNRSLVTPVPDKSTISLNEPSGRNRSKKNSANNPEKEIVTANSGSGNDPDQALAQKKREPGVVVQPFKEEDIVDSAIAISTSQPQPLVTNAADSLKKMLAQSKINAKKKAELPKKLARKPSGWSFGIVAEGGATNISKGSPFELLSKESNQQEDLAYASPAAPNQSMVGGPAGFTQIPENKPAALKSGISWSAGGFVQKELNKRISISIGAQYSYFSMKTQVGQYMKSAISVSNSNYDQIVGAYYQGRSANIIGGGLATASYPRPPVNQDYTNKYHFLEIPVKIHWRVTNEEQLPIIVDGGLSVARLLGTNALHYDGSNDVYYKDYDYFNKIQAGITAGVNVELFSNSKHPVWIGPSIKYQLSNLITSDLSGGQHLWSFGLGAKFFLRK